MGDKAAGDSPSSHEAAPRKPGPSSKDKAMSSLSKDVTKDVEDLRGLTRSYRGAMRN